ncbi:hypothetical protein SKAU_G00295390 [Synaphobranchus kaupii]|uniref:THD domain-containing protein n=1 Tax=Synaphobranchus kaupii TaxID=118154 RepID=A0A9Q1EUN7_SYNKA|nr:hypothetical protein SKAU_G00295390 [Synaphobranchus kaupii]
MEIGNSRVEKYILPWDPGEHEAKPFSVKREHLVVEEGWEGRYFLYIQVTLQSNTSKVPHMVMVKKGDTTLLEGLLTRRGSSELLTTGFLGRQVELYSKESITVSCSPAGYINTTDTATYLGVYLLQRK